MTPADRAALKEKAERATPGPWVVRDGAGDYVVNANGYKIADTSRYAGGGRTAETAQFIAAASPSTVLELLKRIEEAEDLLRDLAKSLATALAPLPETHSCLCEACAGRVRGEVKRIEAFLGEGGEKP